MLFKKGHFILHSGFSTDWFIDMSTLTNEDWDTLAMVASRIAGPFSMVEGVPRGGIPLAKQLQNSRVEKAPLLIVDDVLTTGASMEKQRNGREAIGVVVFARGPCPKWVTPLFTYYDAGARNEHLYRYGRVRPGDNYEEGRCQE